MSPTVRHLDLEGGVRLRVEEHGAGPPIVLLHGFTGDASTMSVLTQRLAATHTVVVPDLIGHGGSTGPADRYGVDAMAAQVIDAVEQLGHPAPFDLVGYSMGGRVAFTMACRHPARVASLSLIGASAGLATAPARAERVAADEALAASILAEGLAPFVDRWMANPLFATQARLGDEFLTAARAQRLRNVPEELARSLRGAGTGTMVPLHDHLAACAMPVALIVGADDEKFTTIARALAPSMPDAEVTVIAQAGHAAHLEQPAAATEAIRSAVGRGARRVHRVSIPLRSTHATGRGTTDRRDAVLVGLRADGHTGWGETSPLPGWSVDGLDETDGLVDGVDPLGGSSAWEATAARRAAMLDRPSARAAVAGAALDLDARRAGRPLWRHLARWHPALDPATAVDTLAVNALVSAPTPDGVEAEVGAAVAAGFGTVKLKVGVATPAVDVQRVTAARRVAPHAVLRLDANGAWDHATAVDVLHRLDPLGIALCEEPVAGIDEIARVAAVVGTPVAVDESLRRPDDLATLLGHAATIAGVIVKPQALGGPDLAVDLITGARAAGFDVVVTSMIDTAVGLAHAAHVAAACGLTTAHGLATASMLTVDVAPGLRVVDGHIPMPDAPGLGIGLVSPPPGAAP